MLLARMKKAGTAGLTLGLSLLAILAIFTPGAQAADTTCPNAKYRTGPSMFLPDCRAYEMVTPPGKANELKLRTGNLTPGLVSADGQTIIYGSVSGPLADGAAAGMPTWERARRGTDGWSLEPAIAPVVSPYVDTLPALPSWLIASESRDRVFFTASAVYSPEQTFTGLTIGNGGVHLTDGVENSWVSRPDWPGSLPAQGTADAKLSNFVPVGGSADLSTVYFVSGATLTAEDAVNDRVARQSWAVYKWKDGQLSNAGVLPDGSISPGGSVAADRSSPIAGMDNLPDAGAMERSRANAVSRNGKSFLFVSPDPARAAVDPALPKPQLYMATEAGISILVSAPEGEENPIAGTTGVALTAGLPVGGGASPGHTLATPNHSVVIFSTVDALTEDADPAATTTVKTYRFEAADRSLTYLPDLDRPTTDGQGQALELSASGDSLLYRTVGNSLRLWREGEPTLTISEGVVAQNFAANTSITHARFAAGEDVLVLNSTGPLRGETDQIPGVNPATFRSEVYRYVVSEDSLECISCAPGGSSGGSALSMWGARNGFSATTESMTAYGSTRGVTDDGSTVFFTTTTPLLDRDHNTVADVYQWRDGQLDLISSGATGSYGEFLYDISADGRSVFISSAEQLVAADSDDFFDVYVARVGGGIDPPAPPASDVGCRGDDCQGAIVESPTLPVVSSVDFVGAGNVATPPRQAIGVKRLRAVSGPVARIRVRVPSAGRIVVTGPAVRRIVRRAARAGDHSLRLVLNPRARYRLARSGKVTAPVRVSFRTAEGTTTRRLKVTFKQAKSKRSHQSAGSGRGR